LSTLLQSSHGDDLVDVQAALRDAVDAWRTVLRTAEGEVNWYVSAATKKNQADVEASEIRFDRLSREARVLWSLCVHVLDRLDSTWSKHEPSSGSGDAQTRLLRVWSLLGSIRVGTSAWQSHLNGLHLCDDSRPLTIRSLWSSSKSFTTHVQILSLRVTGQLRLQRTQGAAVHSTQELWAEHHRAVATDTFKVPLRSTTFLTSRSTWATCYVRDVDRHRRPQRVLRRTLRRLPQRLVTPPVATVVTTSCRTP